MGIEDSSPFIQGATDDTYIGNITDSLKANITNAAGASAVNVQDGGNSLTVDGSVTVTQATGTNLHTVVDSGTITVTQATGTNLHTVVDSGTIAATQSGTWSTRTLDGSGNAITSSLVGSVRELHVGIPDSIASGTATTGTSVAFSCNGINTVTIYVTGLWTGTINFESSQDGSLWFPMVVYEISSLIVVAPSVVRLSSSTEPGTYTVPVAGYSQIRVRAGTVTATVNVFFEGSMGSMFTPVVNTTAANLQTTARLNDGAGTSVTVGQKAMAASLPVVIASDQSAVPASQSGTWNINNVSGTVSLPTGAATSANQTTEITSLQLIDNPIGSVAAGTAGTSSYLTGGVFNTSLPTLTNGQQVGVQLDSSGRQIVAPLTNTSIVKAQLQDNAGTGLTSTLVSAKQSLDVNVVNGVSVGIADKSTFTYGTTLQDTIGGVYQDTSPTLTAGQAGAVRVTQYRALHHTIYDNGGNAITVPTQVGLASTDYALLTRPIPTATSYYSAVFTMDFTGATAANATVFSMRNAAASTRNVYIERLYFMMNWDAGSTLGRTLQYYLLQRFSAATPTTGTAVTAGKYDSSDAASQVTDIRYAQGGLTTTSVSFDTNALGIFGHGSTEAEVATYIKEGVAIKLAAGEGLCIRLGVASVDGQQIVGEVIWSES